MNVRRSRHEILTVMLVALLLTACGPSETGLSADVTQTATAEAPAETAVTETAAASVSLPPAQPTVTSTAAAPPP